MSNMELHPPSPPQNAPLAHTSECHSWTEDGERQKANRNESKYTESTADATVLSAAARLSIRREAARREGRRTYTLTLTPVEYRQVKLLAAAAAIRCHLPSLSEAKRILRAPVPTTRSNSANGDAHGASPVFAEAEQPATAVETSPSAPKNMEPERADKAETMGASDGVKTPTDAAENDAEKKNQQLTFL
jgi:hypothetical protein